MEKEENTTEEKMNSCLALAILTAQGVGRTDLMVWGWWQRGIGR